MPEDDREFFEANSDVYLEVLTDAKEINYFPAVDLESLDEVAADNELDPARKTDFAKASRARPAPKHRSSTSWLMRVSSGLSPRSDRWTAPSVSWKWCSTTR